MKTSLIKKLIASILSVLITFYSLEIADAVAAYAAEEKEQIDLLECVPKDAEMRYHHIKHLDQYDTEDLLVYLNDDGTTTFYLFESNIRYKDENGDLILYDNTLVSVDDSKTLEAGYKYKSKASDVDILFPEHFQGGDGVKLKKGKYSLEMIPVPLPNDGGETGAGQEPTPTPEEASPSATPEASATPEPTPAAMATPEASATPTDTPSQEPTGTPTDTPPPELSNPGLNASLPKTITRKSDDALYGQSMEEQTGKEAVWGDYTSKESGEVEGKYKAKIKDEDSNKKDRKAEYLSSESEDIVYSYSATDTGVKEDIVINRYTGQNTFDFIVKAPGLKLVIFEDRVIEFRDEETDELIFLSENMFAVDSYAQDYIEGEGHFTDDVTVSLIASSNGEHRIRITVPKEYLEDERTVYPVTVDPSYGLYNNQVIDTFINSLSPGTNYASYTYMYMGQGTGSTIRIARCLVKFDMTNFLNLSILGSNITSATYSLYNQSTYTSNFYLRPYKLSVGFVSTTVCWNNFPFTGYGVWNNREYLINRSGWFNINITEMFREWVLSEQGQPGGSTYYGFLMRERDDTYDRLRQFSTAQASSNRPYIVIQYDADRQDPNPVSGLQADFDADAVNPGKSEATVVWDPAVDEPADFFHSGIVEYELAYKKGDGAYQVYGSRIPHDPSTVQYEVTIPNLDPKSYYSFRVKAWDDGTGTNPSEAYETDVYSGDFSPPTAPDEVYFVPGAWTTDISPTIAWNGVGSEDDETLTYEYAVDDPNGTWSPMGTVYNNDAENLISNANFYLGTDWWSANSGSTSTASSNILTNTGNGTSPEALIYHSVSTLPTGNKIYFKAKVRVTNSDCNSISLKLTSDDAYEQLLVDNVEAPANNTWYVLTGIVDAPDYISGVRRLTIQHEYDDAASANGKAMEVDGSNGYKVVLIDLTAEYGAGNEPDIEMCNALYGSQAFKELDLTAKITADGQHNIYVRADDGENKGEHQSGIFYYDATLPVAHIDSPTDTSVVDASVNIIGDVGDATSFAGWELRYAAGDTETTGDFVPENILASDFGESPAGITDGLLYQWNMAGFELEDGPYSLWLRSYDEAGNTDDHFITINKSAVSQSTNPGLVFTNPDPLEDPPEAAANPYVVTYQRDGGDASGLTNIELYVDGELVDTASDSSEELSVDFSDPKYVEGESYYMYLKADDGADEKYTAEFYETPFFDYFNDTTKLALPLDENIEHATDKITLKADAVTGDYPTGVDGYSVTSDFSNTISGYVKNVTIKAEQVLPEDTEIVYEVSNNGVDFQQLDLTGVDLANDGKYVEFTTIGDQIIVRATLKTTDSDATPELLWWTADIEQVAQGQEVKVKLLHEPVNVSVTPNVNYKTLVRWGEDELYPYPEGTTFKVYRFRVDETVPPPSGYSLEWVIETEGDKDLNDASDPDLAENFGPEDAELIAEGLTDKYFYDYNLDYGELYSYKVSAVRDFDEGEGENIRESILSTNALGRMIDENELSKRLGLQDYWKYTGFVTGSGTGQIELSKGNLCYQSTDFVLPGPMFAMVMRRTYNSQATSKTPLGYSHDFSFNTALLREFNTLGDETGVILKDGDGTIHRFVKNIQGLYDTPDGIFMDLTHENEGQEDEIWRICRNDGVDYIFDKYMKLLRFEDRNGSYLEYEYDDRGNFISITDNAGNVIEFRYNEVDLLSEAVVPAIEDDEYRIFEYHYYVDDGDGSILPFLKMRDLRIDEITTDPVTGEKIITNISNENYIEKFSYTDSLVTDIYDGEGYSPTPGAGYATTITYDGEADGYGSISGAGVVTNVEYQIDAANTENFELSYETDATSDYTDIIFYGNTTKYRHDADGCITQIVNPLGQDINYQYNADYQVTQISYDNYVNGSATAQTLQYNFTYDAHNNITSITDAEGNITTYDYGTEPNYNPFDKPDSVTVQSQDLTKSITTNYTYYDVTGNTGNLYTARDPMYDSGTGFGQITNTYYTQTWEDSSGRRGYPGQLKTTTDRYGNTTSYEYNSKGWLSKTTDAQNNVTSYQYDNMGNGIFITDAEQRTHKIEYDILGRKIKAYYPNESATPVEQWTYNKNHNVTSYVLGQGGDLSTTYYYYDDMNRLIQTEVDNGASDITISIISYDYVSQGAYSTLTVRTIDSSSIEAVERYDSAGRLVQTATKFGATEKNVTDYTYDNIGNMTQITDDEGRVVKAEYDKLNRTTKTIVDPGDATHLNYTAEYEYDYLGRNTKVTDGEGAETFYDYDDLNRLSEVTQSPDGGTTDYVTGYTYDIVSGNYIINQIEDAAGGIKQTWYDSLGLVYKEADDGTNEDAVDLEIVSTYHYDDIGRLEYKEFNDGTILGYTYNSKGYVEYEKYYDDSTDYGGGVYSDYSHYVYDTRGNLTDMDGEQDGDTFSYEWTYNILNQTVGQVERVTYDDGDGQTTDLAASQIIYAYRTNGQLLQIKYPSALDESAPVMSTYYEYDSWGRVSAIKRGTDLDKDTVRTYTYDDTGMVQTATTYLDFDGSGSDYMLADYDYNAAGLVTGIEYKLNGATQKENYQYAYNDNGMITDEDITFNYGTPDSISKDHTYDDIGRLLTTTEGGTTTTYTYDEVGNRLTQADGTDSWTYQYSELYQLLEIQKNSNTEFDYEYDDLGRQTQQQEYNSSSVKIEEQNFTYFDNGMLKSSQIIDSDGSDPTVNESYMYNADSQRMIKDTDGVLTKYFYSGSAVLLTADQSNNKLTENIVDLSGTIVSSKRFSPAADWYSYNYDVRQSTTAILNGAGALVTNYDYDAFGNTSISGSTSFLNETQFTGAIADMNTGLYYMNARYYNANTGRFLSQDSYKGSMYEPWTQNLYSYVGNNPVNFTDPTGHLAGILAALGIVTVVAVAVACIALIPKPEAQEFSLEAFKDNVSSTWNSLTHQFTTGLTNIGNWVTSTYEYTTTQAKNYVSLTSSLIDAKTKAREKEDSKKTNVHHIVAQSAAAAEPARRIIEDNGINRQDHDNKVAISQEMHQYTHTAAYYESINVIIDSVNESTKDNVIKERRLRTTLKIIGGIFKLIDSIY